MRIKAREDLVGAVDKGSLNKAKISKYAVSDL
jgi:hypothetical protein